jgi:DNA-binding CsgD family transcriptional regulator
MDFLQYACSDLTYKEIASKMNLSERTIDGYRESLFGKLKVQSRVGLCLEAIRKGYVSL